MNLTSKPMLAGAGGLIIGALIGLGLGSSGGSGGETEAETQRELAAGVGALSETIKGVDARIATLEGRIETVEGSVSALGEAQTGRLDALSARLEGFGSEIGGQVSSIGGAVAASLGQGIDALKSELAAVGKRLQAPMPASSGTVEDQPGAEAGAPPRGELVLIGSAASFGETLSVFVSGIDQEARTARVAVNGPATITLALGEPAEAAGCQVTLTGFSQGGAYIDGVCGEASAAAAEPAAAAPTAGGAAPEGDAIRIGAAGNFGAGKVRIFVSGVNPEAMTARVALNSLRTAEMRLQDKVEAEGCQVELTGISAEGAVFKVDC